MGGSGGYSAAAGSTVQSQSGVPSGGAPTSPGPGGAFPNMGGVSPTKVNLGRLLGCRRAGVYCQRKSCFRAMDYLGKKFLNPNLPCQVLCLFRVHLFLQRKFCQKGVRYFKKLCIYFI